MGSSVGAGSKHTVFNYGNQLRCVGANNRGQLGAGNTDFYSVPAIIEGFSGVSWVTAGTDFSGCIAEDTSSSKNTVYMWGANKYGQLGDGTIKDKWSPVKVNIPVEEEETPLKISAGANHTLCATATRIYAWGCNRSGQLGNGGVEDSRYPIEVPIPSEYAGQPVRYISAGTNFSACVIGNDILVWGDNTYGSNLHADTPYYWHAPEYIDYNVGDIERLVTFISPGIQLNKRDVLQNRRIARSETGDVAMIDIGAVQRKL